MGIGYQLVSCGLIWMTSPTGGTFKKTHAAGLPRICYFPLILLRSNHCGNSWWAKIWVGQALLVVQGLGRGPTELDRLAGGVIGWYVWAQGGICIGWSVDWSI